MPFELNQKLREIKPYDPGTGEYPVRLDANESYISMPDDIREQICEAVRSIAFNRYPDPTAAKLCAAFADYYGIDPAFVTAANGSDELLYIISTCFTSNGDTVVTTAPDFSMYSFYSYLAECRQVVYNKRELEISAKGIIDLCNKNDAKLLIFSNPCNPTGRGLDRDEVRLILNKVNCLVVLDEAYMDFWDQSLIDEIQNYPNAILLKTMSKAIGCAALRLGFAVANETITTAIRAAKSPYNVNSVSQAAGEIILKQRELLTRSTADIIMQKVQLYCDILPICDKHGWTIKPSFTNFIFVEMSDSTSVYEFLKSKGIVVRNFATALRITAGSADENAALISALKEWK